MIDYTEGSNKQYHTQLEENGVGDYVILTGDPKRVKDIASYLDEIHHEYHDLRSWFLKHEEECDDLYQLLQEEFFRATNVSLEICTYLKSYLEMDMYSIIICDF